MIVNLFGKSRKNDTQDESIEWLKQELFFKEKTCLELHDMIKRVREHVDTAHENYITRVDFIDNYPTITSCSYGLTDDKKQLKSLRVNVSRPLNVSPYFNIVCHNDIDIKPRIPDERREATLDIYSDNCFINKGYGSLLMNESIRLLQYIGVSRVYGKLLITNDEADNSRRIHYYEKFKFTIKSDYVYLDL